MHPIQEPQTPKINPEQLMMQIMHPRTTIQKVIPTMHRRRLRQLERQERPISQDMTFQKLRGERDGEDVGEDVFERVRVLGC